MGADSGAGGVQIGVLLVAPEALLGVENVELPGQVVVRWRAFKLPSVVGCLLE